MNRADELLEYLAEQYRFLSNSSALYDAGELHEAKRLAVSLRVLVHQTKRTSHSLLNQLQQEFSIQPKILGKVKHIDVTKVQYYGDFQMHLVAKGGIVECVPRKELNNPNLQEITIEDWWNQFVLISDGFKLRRKDVMLNMANQDGGAHVDPSMNQGYRRLSREDLIGFKDQSGNPIPNVHLVMARENSFYMQVSLVNYFGSLLAFSPPC